MNTITPSNQQLGSLFEAVPRQRQPAPAAGLSASIWAPQPQPSDSAWSKAIESINKVPENYASRLLRPEMRRASSHPIESNPEDVFGPVGLVGDLRKKDVGAIGDGRKKTPPNFDPMVHGFCVSRALYTRTNRLSKHVQQLLRALNLSSPGPLFPTAQTQDLRLGSSAASPDVSPTSTTSALLTPPELSPAKGYGEWKFSPAYDFGPGSQGQSTSTMLFETDTLRRYHDVVGSSQHSTYGPIVANTSDPFQSSAHTFASFEPFSDRGPVSSGEIFPRLETASAARQGPDPSLLHPSWGHQRLRTSSADWVKADDRHIFEFGGASDVNLSSSHSSRSHTNAHEVSICVVSDRATFITREQPINFLSLLHPSSSPPYHLFVSRVIKSSDQQASIFLQQKLKVADSEERAKIVDAICARGFDMMAHRYDRTK
jgi:pumilio RNA-binding family